MRLLIADDEINLAKALRAVLEDEGYNCGVCFDGNNAIRLIFQEIYDGLILDIMIKIAPPKACMTLFLIFQMPTIK